MLIVKYIDTEEEYCSALAIRKEVFIVEQHVSRDEEIDEYESSATHIVALKDGRASGTARWRFTDRGVKLERFAVLKSLRKKGIGSALLQFALDELCEESNIYLNAQERVISFYEKFNFRGVGNIFYEANIPHLKMVYHKLDND
jgi:predicted GNAT family N-acyltransferase